VSQLSDVIRSGIRAEDLTGLTPEQQQALEPLLRFVNTGIQGLAQALTGQVDSSNLDTEIQTVPLTNGVAQLVSLKKLSQARGIRSLSVGSADGKTQHALAQPLHLIGTTVPNQVKVVANFMDTTASRVPVTFELTPDGSYTSLTPSSGTWTAFPYAVNWSDLGGGNMAGGLLKDSLGFVHLRGLTKWSQATNPIPPGTVIGTLPVGFRPSASIAFAVANWNGAAFVDGVLDILTSGAVRVQLAANGGANTSGLDLDGVSFDTRS